MPRPKKKEAPPKKKRERIEVVTADPDGPHVVYMAVEELPELEGNAKDHSVEDICASIRRFGFVTPLTIDERTGRIAEGHGRREALLRMHRNDEAPPERVRVGPAGEWLVPVLRGIAFRDDREAHAFALASNRLVEVGGWSDEALAAVLRDLSQNGNDLDGTGWTLPEVDQFLSALDPPPPKDKPEKPVEETEKGTSKLQHECPSCGHVWTA